MRNVLIILSLVVFGLLSCEKEKSATSLELTVKYNGQILPNWTINANNAWDDEIIETKTTNANGIVIFSDLQDKLTLHKNDSTNSGDSYYISVSASSPNQETGSISNFWYRLSEGDNLKEEFVIW